MSTEPHPQAVEPASPAPVPAEDATPAPRPSRWSRLGIPAAAAALGLWWFIAKDGGEKLSPTHLGWLMQGDWGAHYLGWAMFRAAPWGFPLGHIPTLGAPVGTFVGYTDSNPWMAVLFKVFSGWLPHPFQYIGPWMGLSFALQGVMGALLVRQLTPRWSDQLLGAMLFVLSPVLLHREGHDTLTAHWLLLGMFWLHLRPCADRRTAWRLWGWAAGFAAFACGVHPYLGAMVVVLGVALLWRLVSEGQLSWRSGLGAGAGLVAVGLIVFTLFGYFAVSARGGSGFGLFSADLLTFLNPMDFHHLLPELPRLPQQGEGYGYLGAGGLLLVALAIGLAVFRRGAGLTLRRRQLVPLAVASALLAIFAVSGTVRFAGRPVLDLQWLYRPFGVVVGPFRSSGRFIWAAHYLLILWGIAAAVRLGRIRAALGTGLLALAVGTQLVDLRAGWSPGFGAPHRWARFSSPAWALARGHYLHLALYPAVVFNGDWTGCPTPFPLGIYLPAGELAVRLGMSSNSAYMARADPRILAACKDEETAMREGRFDPKTIYVIHPSRVRELAPHASALTCAMLEGLPVCVSAGNRDPFHDFLARFDPRR